MSKFLDETQKARQWGPPAPLTGPLDVVSVMDAIKQGEVVVASTVDAHPADDVPVAAEKPIRGPIKTSKDADSLPAPATEAYGVLRTRIMRLQASKGIRSLMLTSSLPAEGKSLTAVNLAVSCAKLHNLKILLVDADLRSRGMTRFLEIPEGPGLCDFLTGEVSADQAVFPTEHNNLFLLGAGSPARQPAELFASLRWSEFISWASQSYSIVIVDAPPIYSLSDAELISAGCDGVLIVLKALSTPRDIAEKCVGRLDKRKLVGIVFNGLPTGPESAYGYYGTEA